MSNFEDLKKNIVELLMVSNGVAKENFDSEYKILYVVEGHSASSGIRTKRDPQVHGVLALRGKILNVYGRNLSAAMKSPIVKEYLTILKNDNAKYDLIIDTTDADADGAHITTLLTTCTVKFLPEYIKQGKFVLCDTPFYTFVKDKTTIAWGNNKTLSIEELEPYIKSLTENAKQKFADDNDLVSFDEIYSEKLNNNPIKKDIVFTNLMELCKIKIKHNKGLGSYNYEEIKKLILYPQLGTTFTRMIVDKNANLALESAMKRGAVEFVKIDPDADRYGLVLETTLDDLTDEE